MLRKEASGRFERVRDGWFGPMVWQFETKTLRGSAKWNESGYRDLISYQQHTPVHVMSEIASGRRWWMYCGEFYWENDELTAEEVRVLVLDRQQQRQKRIDRATARVAVAGETSQARREAIPDSIKTAVWQRDGGRCVTCGSRSQLEFDHIIPVTKGGSSTARNLQLLCAPCNRSKGPNLT
jgi:5-methylcytosine-specific restriction endonuclease McrA